MDSNLKKDLIWLVILLMVCFGMLFGIYQRAMQLRRVKEIEELEEMDVINKAILQKAKKKAKKEKNEPLVSLWAQIKTLFVKWAHHPFF